MLNPKIINVLFKLCEVESFGSGFERVFEECKKLNVEYQYDNTNSGFRFTFYRSFGQENVHKINSKMSKDENQVFQLIKRNNMITIGVISKEINKSTEYVVLIDENGDKIDSHNLLLKMVPCIYG